MFAQEQSFVSLRFELLQMALNILTIVEKQVQFEWIMSLGNRLWSYLCGITYC